MSEEKGLKMADLRKSIESFIRLAGRVHEAGEGIVRLVQARSPEEERLRDEFAGLLEELEEGRRSILSLLESSGEVVKMGELSAAVAHEIRNNLCALVFALEVLESYVETDGSMRKVVDNIRLEAEKMEKVVKNLLNFSRNYEPRKSPWNLRDVVEGSIRAVRSHIAKKGVRVEVECPGSAPVALVDRGLLEHVFTNLIINAVDASEPEGVVRLRLSEEGDRVRVDVEDHGCGIPPDAVGRVFEPFFTGKEKGVGLGLAVSKKIVDAHGGEMTVKSKQGEGTVFSVLLPKGV